MTIHCNVNVMFVSNCMEYMDLCGNLTLYVKDLNLSFLSCDSVLVQYRAVGGHVKGTLPMC